MQDSSDMPVKIYIKATGAPINSTLSWHVHTTGNITDTTAGLTTLTHFNPHNTTHGCFNSTVRHAGDLDSLTSNSKGNIEITISTDLLSLYQGSSTFAIGRALVVHAKKDDCTGTNGNAGDRLAQGVIGFRNKTLKFDGNLNVSVVTYQTSKGEKNSVMWLLITTICAVLSTGTFFTLL
ncbi:Superoxide dismutase [Cu-Zn] [Nowakowskiella sp. JEL0078]|nr:Superoxide dismutase [Cu-Zn] [Nowakowskiella sp. JEL0078]